MTNLNNELSIDQLNIVVGGVPAGDGSGTGNGTGHGGHGIARGIRQIVKAVEGVLSSIWPF